MPQRIEIDGTVHEFPDDFTDADIAAALSSEPAQPMPSHAPNQISQMEWDALSAGEKMQRGLQWAGRAIGGAFMGPEGVNAADHPATTLASAAIPPIAGSALTAGGRASMKGAVALLPKTLKQQVPNMARTAFDEGIGLTRRGMEKAGRLVSESRGQADDLLAAAERSGAPRVSPRRVITELRPVADKMRTQASLGKPNDVPALAARARTFARANKGGIELTRAQAMKREAQDLADTAYKAADRGATINNMEVLTDQAQARGLRAAIEEIVPEVGPINARTQALAGVRRGAEHAAETGHIVSRLGGAGAGLAVGSGAGVVPAAGTAAVGSLLTTPGGLSRLALLLKMLGMGADSNIARGVTVGGMLASHEPNQ